MSRKPAILSCSILGDVCVWYCMRASIAPLLGSETMQKRAHACLKGVLTRFCLVAPCVAAFSPCGLVMTTWEMGEVITSRYPGSEAGNKLWHLMIGIRCRMNLMECGIRRIVLVDVNTYRRQRVRVSQNSWSHTFLHPSQGNIPLYST